MNARVLLAVSAVLAFVGTGRATDGKAVTVVNNLPVLITVRANAVTSTQSIAMPAGTQEAGGPFFSFDGTKIVMFRRAGSSAWLSVVRLQDMQVTDILRLDSWPKEGVHDISWPVGDWIYYPKPNPSGDVNWKIFNQIWRVNVKDTTLNQYVYNYSPSGHACGCWLKWWNSSADGQYATSMIEGTPMSDINPASPGVMQGQNATFHCFPPQEAVVPVDPYFFVREYARTDCPERTRIRTCNNYLSCGANFFTHYSGWHGELWIEYWNKATGSYTGVQKKYGTCFMSCLCNPEVNAWAGVDPDGYDTGNRPTFACNSEKWISLEINKQAGGGSDHYLINWIDRVAIRTTANTAGAFSPSGHFFVEGGPANAWEDTSGVWHTLSVPPDSSLVSAPTIVSDQGTVLTTTQEGYNAEIMDIGAGSGSVTYIFSPVQVTMACPTTGAQIRYTTDGSDPTESSALYSAPVSVSSTTTVRARAFKSGSNPSHARAATFVAAREPDNPSSTVAGLWYSYYEGASWEKIPNFDSLSVVESGTCLNFDLSTANRADNFGYRFDGYVEVPSDKVYEISTSSDDGSRLFIGDLLVVNNDGNKWGNFEFKNFLGLKAGKHAIRVEYFDKGSAQTLTVKTDGQAIAPARLFRSAESPVSRPARQRRGVAGPSIVVTAGRITINASRPVLVRVFDTKGSMVFSKTVAGAQAAGLPRIGTGCYSVRITDGAKALTRRVVVP